MLVRTRLGLLLSSCLLGLWISPQLARSDGGAEEPALAAIQAALPAGWFLAESKPDQLPYGHYWGDSYDGPRGQLLVFSGPADRYMSWRDRDGGWHRDAIGKEALEIWIMPPAYAESWRRFLKPMRPTPAARVYSNETSRVYGKAGARSSQARIDEIVEKAAETRGYDPALSWSTWQEDLRTRLAAKSPGEFDVRFGRVGIVWDGSQPYQALLEETTVVPRDVGGLTALGFEVRPAKAEPYEIYSVHHLPKPPPKSPSFTATEDGGLRTETATVRGPRVFSFGFEEGDPLGTYRIDVYVNDRLIKSASLEVVEARPEPDLSAARTAVETLYRCFETTDLSLCRGVLDDESSQVLDEPTVKALHDQVASHAIVKAREVTEPDPQFGIQEGDAEILVDVTYRESRSVTSYVVRREGSEWKIVSWVMEDPAEEPPDDLSVPPLE